MEAGGAETHILELAQALEKRGHRVILVSSGGRLADEVRCQRTCKLPLNTHDPLRLFAAYLGLNALIRQENPDIIHTHARIPAYLVSLSKRKDTVHIATVHARFRTDGLRKTFSHWGDCQIAVSKDLKDYLIGEYQVTPKSITVIPNGIDTMRFSPSPVSLGENSSAPSSFHLVFMSRMDKDCALGAFLILALIPRLKEKIPDIRITLIGGGNAYTSVASAADVYNRRYGHLITVTGHVEAPEKILRTANAFLGVSRAALEAMACGIPVILGGNEGFGGLLTKDKLSRAESENFCCRTGAPMTEKNLYPEILRLAKASTAFRQSLGEELRDYVIHRHGLAIMAEKTEQVYRHALLNRRLTGGILLCGYYGYGNTGDDTLLQSAYAKARQKYPGIPISALTLHGKKDSPRFGIRCVCRSSPIAVWKEFRQTKILVFGGGTLLQDMTSRRSLFYYASLLHIAQHRGIRCELWANGIGHLTHPVCRKIAAKVLAGCSYIGLRDRHSMHELASLVSEFPSYFASRNYDPGNTVLEQDLAFSVSPAPAEQIDNLLRTVGIAPDTRFVVAALKGHGEKHAQNALLQILRKYKEHGFQIVFIEMYPHEDRKDGLRFCTLLGGIYLKHLCAAEIIGIMKRATLVCSMRLHALIFASAAKTPALSFGSDPKLKAYGKQVK